MLLLIQKLLIETLRSRIKCPNYAFPKVAMISPLVMQCQVVYHQTIARGSAWLDNSTFLAHKLIPRKSLMPRSQNMIIHLDSLSHIMEQKAWHHSKVKSKFLQQKLWTFMSSKQPDSHIKFIVKNLHWIRIVNLI